METIFENSKTIKKSDILTQIGIGISFIIMTFFISKIRFINESMNKETYLIMGIGLSILFLYLIFTSKTIKRIEKQKNENKLIFTIPKLSDVKLLIHAEFKDALINSIETDVPAK